MHAREMEGGADNTIESGTVLWNCVPFESILPVARSDFIVRTRPVLPHLRRHYTRIGWPRELVLLREFHIKLVSEDLTLFITTTAPEAEYELPDKITTSYRALGTFLDATLHWKGRKEETYVSARVTEASDQLVIDALTESTGTLPASPQATAQLHSMAIADGALQSGLLVPATIALPAQMQPEDRKLANLLMSYKDPVRRLVLSMAEIALVFNCSDETIRRRMSALFTVYPSLKNIVLGFRSRKRKGFPPETLAQLSPAALGV
ncbi:MAG: hypothetical protein NTY53_23800 [Kiritimatiellaeota bacterium]|nr:hypothetical protein [Kiritimatiellota bacterium]